MAARVEQQRVMYPGISAPMHWRAVCDDHEGGERFIAAWQSRNTHKNWIDATIDARLHDAIEHEWEDEGDG